MIYLLDVNVLIALIDVDHVFHEQAHRWFGGTPRNGWATCPTSENDALRILGHSRYPGTIGAPASLVPVLQSLIKSPGHVFWPNDLSLLTSPLIIVESLGSAGRVTDAYLLALAASRKGQLATFDRRLSTAPVRNGQQHLHVIR